MTPEGGHSPARGTARAPALGHIQCAICAGLIGLDQYRQARCWTDPEGITVAAHATCLIRVGERDLGLA
jgi:hypothetical protein